jgi:hypothetical protein
LPLTRDYAQSIGLTLVVAVLLAGVSLVGLFLQNVLYPTEALRQTFVSNDVVNLFIGLPILLGSVWLARTGSLLGLLAWPGALFYVLYNAIAYAVAMPLTVQFVAYLALIGLGAFTLFRLITGQEARTVHRRLNGAVPVRLGGGVLIGLGALFFLRAIGQVASGQGTVAEPEFAVLAADLITTPFWVAGGILLWRRQPLGYAIGLGLLFQGSLLFVALLVFFILQPFLTGTPFALTDFVVIAVMGSICFTPLGLFVRGVLRAGR